MQRIQPNSGNIADLAAIKDVNGDPYFDEVTQEAADLYVFLQKIDQIKY